MGVGVGGLYEEKKDIIFVAAIQRAINRIQEIRTGEIDGGLWLFQKAYRLAQMKELEREGDRERMSGRQ